MALTTLPNMMTHFLRVGGIRGEAFKVDQYFVQHLYVVLSE